MICLLILNALVHFPSGIITHIYLWTASLRQTYQSQEGNPGRPPWIQVKQATDVAVIGQITTMVNSINYVTVTWRSWPQQCPWHLGTQILDEPYWGSWTEVSTLWDSSLSNWTVEPCRGESQFNCNAAPHSRHPWAQSIRF